MNAVVVTAISEYPERRKLEHIRRLGVEFARDHAEVLRRLARS